MTYTAWERRHRVTTIMPGKSDLFVVTFVEGKRAHVDNIYDYDVALERARAFHQDHPCQIKVIPLSGPEFCNMFGIEKAASPEPMDEATRGLLVARLTDIVCNSADRDARTDAVALLKQFGELPS
jgi:hypothetical protein